jgi:hypothetical protein
MSYVREGHYVKVTPGFYGHGGTKVEIDGVEVQQLVNVEFRHHVDEAARLTITIYPQAVEIEGLVTEVKASVIDTNLMNGEKG